VVDSVDCCCTPARFWAAPEVERGPEEALGSSEDETSLEGLAWFEDGVDPLGTFMELSGVLE